MKKTLIISTCILLTAAAWAQTSLPVDELRAESVSSASNTLLFNTWVKASVRSHNPLLANDSGFWFDYDRLSQRLLATVDKKSEFSFDGRDIQSVTFYLGLSAFTFAHVPAINEKDLFLVMVSSEKGYSLYKSFRWVPSKQGYLEWDDYHIVFPFPDSHVLTVSVIDKRQLDHAFGLTGDKKKLDRFFALHAQDDQGERFLKALIEYLNR